MDEMKQAKFKRNNGKVIRRINLLRHKYIDLESVCAVMASDGVSEGEFLDCVNFLSEAGYIHLRTIRGHLTACIADVSYRDVEAKVSEKGIRLLAGGIMDEMVPEV